MTTEKKLEHQQALEGLDWLQPYLHERQRQALRESCCGEEGAYFRGLVFKLVERFLTAPHTRQQQNEQDPIAHFHYFMGGCDWYILELDKGRRDDRSQHQAFAWCNLGDDACAELGYVSLPELFSVRHPIACVELDLYWEPTPLSQCRPDRIRAS